MATCTNNSTCRRCKTVKLAGIIYLLSINHPQSFVARVFQDQMLTEAPLVIVTVAIDESQVTDASFTRIRQQFPDLYREHHIAANIPNLRETVWGIIVDILSSPLPLPSPKPPTKLMMPQHSRLSRGFQISTGFPGRAKQLLSRLFGFVIYQSLFSYESSFGVVR